MCRYLEASNLNKSLEALRKVKKDDALIVTSLLVDRFDKGIPVTTRQSYSHFPIKNLYKKSGQYLFIYFYFCNIYYIVNYVFYLLNNFRSYCKIHE